MSTPPSRRARKRLATREHISDVATRLFFEHGFDRVTVADIAQAADVGRMTVFNYFPRKEDMFFDLDEPARADLVAAVRDRAPSDSPIEALRGFAHDAVAQRRPYVSFSVQSQQFIRTIDASEALKARARAIRDELTQEVCALLAESAGRDASDVQARLLANLLVATATVAFQEGHRTFQKVRNAAKASEAMLAVIDAGAAGLLAMMAGTPYATAA